MTTKQMIASYVNQCIEDKSSGFRTDFGIGAMVSTHVYFHLNLMVVTIEKSRITEEFSTNKPDAIIEWIYEQIK